MQKRHDSGDSQESRVCHSDSEQEMFNMTRCENSMGMRKGESERNMSQPIISLTPWFCFTFAFVSLLIITRKMKIWSEIH